MRISKQIALITFSLIAAFLMTGCTTVEPGTTVYIVRHAEKVTTPDVGHDPNLTEAGHARAQLLSEMLADKNISRIHSSDYIRNRDTAKPLSDKIGVEIEIYDPSDLKGIANKIETAGGTHFVVGHSNTIAETVVALNGDGGTKVSDNEYDRLYKVYISSDGKVKTDLSRFGEKYVRSEK